MRRDELVRAVWCLLACGALGAGLAPGSETGTVLKSPEWAAAESAAWAETPDLRD